MSIKSNRYLLSYPMDGVIQYPVKVLLNCYYYRYYSFWKDIEMIFTIVLGRKVKFAGEEV